MKERYICENCGLEFTSKEKCMEHEQECGKEESFTCMKCGKTITWIKHEDYFTANECWDINLGRAGYGSGLDGCDIHIQVCDDCLREWIDSFTYEGQEHIINSGCNQYMSTEDWIKEAKGEMTDEEYEQNGMYSPRQRKAYKERFPICDKVKIRVYNDGSAGSRCSNMFGALGNEFGEVETKPSDKCYNCNKFKVREKDKLIEVVDACYGENTPVELIEAHKQKYIEYIKSKEINT